MAESANTLSRPRVLSGMRPTGKLHLGNYMGALANWVKLQDQYECYFFIADLHALTTDYADPSRIKLNTLDVALDWLAAGLDPGKSTIFIQSHVPQHAELHLLFSMITPLGWLERVPTYKEMQENLSNKDLTTYGFLGYPVLMSSDILLYQANFVPVGQDQQAHVELTREVARRFNSMYKTSVFPEPEALFTPSPKVPGTDGRKMSKSYGNTIGLTEAAGFVVNKVLRMSTNGQRVRQTDQGDPELCPVSDIHKVFSSSDVTSDIQMRCRNASISCITCKERAAHSICDTTAPFIMRREEFASDRQKTWEMLQDQSSKAAIKAEQTMQKVREILGVSRNYDKVSLNFAQKDGLTSAFFLVKNASDFKLPPVHRALKIRVIWVKLVMSEGIILSQTGNFVNFMPERELEEPFVTTKNKRVFVSTQYETGNDGSFRFSIPPRSYEAWALLCWDRTFFLSDFVIPQKYYSQSFAQAKKSLKKDEKIPVTIRKDGERFLLSIHGSDPVDVTELRSNYEPLM